MYAFIGLNPLAIFAEEEGSPDPSYYDVIHHLISKDYYIDLPEEMVLKMLIDWANIDFQVRTISKCLIREVIPSKLLKAFFNTLFLMNLFCRIETEMFQLSLRN